MKNKNHIIRLAAGFSFVLVVVGLFTFPYVFAQNEQQTEETIKSCIEWINDFEEESFFEDVTTPTFSAKTIHFGNLLANSYKKSFAEIPPKIFPQRTVSERDFLYMLQDFNRLTKKQNASWFNLLLAKKTNKKLTQAKAIRLANSIFNLPQKTILAKFRQTRSPRRKWILRHEAAQALYHLALQALPESPEQSLCKEWANNDAETFNETFGQEEINPPTNTVGTSTSNGTASDTGTITLPTTDIPTIGTSTPSTSTQATPSAPAPLAIPATIGTSSPSSTTPVNQTAPASPVVPATTGTSTQSVTTPTGTTTQPSLPIISDSPPTIISITPYVPIPFNKNFISSITLQWSTVDNSTGVPTYYKIWRRLGSGDWLLWGQTQQTTFPDLNIGRGTYDYYLKACSTGTATASYGLVISDCGRDSNIMTATLAGGGDTSDITLPSTPTGLKAWPDPYNRNFISWTASTDNVGVAGYNIYRNGIYLKSVSGSPAEDGFLFSSSTPFSYTVAAYDAAGNISAQSASVSVTTQ